MYLTDVVDSDGKVVQTIDLDENCMPYRGGDYHGHCGGCGNCMGMQATYAGYKLQDHIEGIQEVMSGSDEHDNYLEVEEDIKMMIAYNRVINLKLGLLGLNTIT